MRNVVLSLLSLALVSMVGPGAAALGRGGADRRPNIVLIVADDLGYGHLGCYGQKLIRTPKLDRLAAQGARFTAHYSGSSVCAPSRSCLMTGLHTGHTPVRNNGLDRHLFAADLTLAEVLQRAGYRTGGFGKWGIGDIHTPGVATRQGFETWFGQYNQTHAHFFYPYWLWENEARHLLPQNEGGARRRYAHDVIHRQALRFIRATDERPFFAYLPYILPHVELVVPEDSERPYRGRFPKVPLPDPRPGYLGSDDGLTTYAGMISRLDAHVGEVLETLRETGRERDTLVVFTSDNGPQGGNPWSRLVDFFDGNGPFRGSKGDLYEGGLRVPLLVRWPGRVPAGRVLDVPSANWDLFPTLADAAGTAVPAGLDGRSLVPLLRGRPQPAERVFYWEMPGPRGMTQAVRQGKWKLVRPRPGGPFELYDLSTDPAESGDLAQRFPEEVRRLAALAEREHLPEREYPPAPPRSVGQFVR